MSAEIQAHLFEPCFTTKEKGKGTGLGLTTVYSIVHQSGGHIDFHSELQKGSTFAMYLPRVAAAVEPGDHPKSSGPLRGSETVLVAEDEPELRSMLERILQHYGYTVLMAASTHEALSLSVQHPQPIHVLLTDVVMPGMSGRALAERIIPLRPGIKVLYISGYTDDTLFQHGVVDPAMAFLQKPFTPETLARKVREVLDRGTSR